MATCSGRLGQCLSVGCQKRTAPRCKRPASVQCRVLGLNKKSAEHQSCQISVAPCDPLHPLSGACLSPAQCYAPTALAFAAGTLLAFFILKFRREQPQELPDLPATHDVSDDPRHHQRCLAKARQAQHLQSAVAYCQQGEVTKSLLELHKALQDNSICRAQAVLTCGEEAVAGLYRLHLTNTEQPPNFAALLQLQEMLGISQEEAERLEREVMHTPGAFAI